MEVSTSALAARDVSQPCLVVKVSHIDYQTFSLPVADGVAKVRGIHVGAMRPAVGRYKAKTPWRAILFVIEKHEELGRLNNLAWSAHAWDPGRLTVECWVVTNFVRGEFLYLCQQLGFIRRRIRIHHVPQLLAERSVKFGCGTALVGGRVYK